MLQTISKNSYRLTNDPAWLTCKNVCVCFFSYFPKHNSKPLSVLRNVLCVFRFILDLLQREGIVVREYPESWLALNLVLCTASRLRWRDTVLYSISSKGKGG